MRSAPNCRSSNRSSNAGSGSARCSAEASLAVRGPRGPPAVAAGLIDQVDFVALDPDRATLRSLSSHDHERRVRASRKGATDTVAPAGSPTAGAERVNRYVARVLQQHLVDDPGRRYWIADGTAAFVDISGFTKLSEQLARKGREGAEQITEAIGAVFESMLAVAYENGGSLLKFGGDALLLWFEGEGHATRACRATVLMRGVLREVGRIELPDAKVTLQMSQGVHSGSSIFSPSAARTSSCCRPVRRGAAWSRWSTRPRPARSSSAPRRPRSSRAECVGRRQGPGPAAAARAARRRREDSAAPAAGDGARDHRALPVAGDPRARARRRRDAPSTGPSRSRSSASRAPTR